MINVVCSYTYPDIQKMVVYPTAKSKEVDLIRSNISKVI